MTAVTHPRVRVDNEIKQFTYYGKKICHRKIENTVNELYFAGWQPQNISNFTKIEVPPEFEAYDAEDDPDEKVKPKATPKKGTFTLPKSTAFSNMMRAEMNSATTQGPRKLKKDDYKEYLIETVEEKNALKAKPKPKAKAAPKASWRSNGGFKIPSKAEQEAEKKKVEEEKTLIPAPTEYKAPPPAPEPKKVQVGKGNPPVHTNQQNKGNQGKKKRNNNRKKKGKGKAPPPHGQKPYYPQENYGYDNNYYNEGYDQNYDGYNQNYGGYDQKYKDYDY